MEHIVIPYNILRQVISGHRRKLFHGYADWGNELVIVFDGIAIFELDNQRFSLRKGDIFVLTGDYHKEIHDAVQLNMCSIFYRDTHLQRSSASFRWLEGFQRLFLEYPISKKYSDVCRLHASDELLEDLTSLIARMEVEQLLEEAGFAQVLNSIFFVIITLISRAYSPKEAAYARSGATVVQVVSYLRAHYDREFSLEQLASMANTSPRNFNRKFQQICNTTPVQYVNNLRIERAHFLLQESSLSILEIAMEVGFADANYFAKLFREKYGRSPSQYRAERLLSLQEQESNQSP